MSKHPVQDSTLDPSSNFFAEDMYEELADGICEIEFTKADGSKRTMMATRTPKMIPAKEKIEPIADENINKESAMPVWDLEKKAWRSIVPSSVISFKML